MPDSRATDILARQSELESERSEYESVWEKVAEFCDPDAPDQFRNHGSRGSGSQPERSERRGARVYDNTINIASNRLMSGLESLTIPQSEKWHSLSTAAIDDEETDEEREWAEDVRDLLFSLRYSANSNFVPATQACLRNLVQYGPAYLYAEEGFGGTLMRYASIPVIEAYIARNRWGEVDTLHRKYERTARQCAQMFGYGKLPANVRMLLDDPAKSLEKVRLIQCIRPREERRTYRIGDTTDFLDTAFVSYHVIEEEEEIVKEAGFRTFPVACFNWRRYEGDTYGTSPTIDVLTAVREINAVRRTGLRALQQVTDPALATRAKLDYIPTLNPGAHYPGLLADDGRPLVAPITTGQNPQFAFDYAAARAEDIRRMMFVDLFQVLVDRPDMTATEALIRQEEKGQLLGPAGSVIQAALSTNLDRELSILEAKGLYDADSRFLPPPSLAGKTVRPTFTSPLDIYRRSAEGRDADMVVTSAVQYAGAAQDPSILDNIDGDEYLRIKKDASRAPQRLLRSKDEVAALREERARAQQAQMGMAAMQQAAAAARDAVPAAVQAREAGLLPGMAPR